MKTFIALLLATSTLLIIVPDASACELQDETNLTTTCVSEQSIGDPACDDAYTSAYHATQVSSDVRGFAQVDAYGARSCFNDGWARYESQNAGVTVRSGQTQLQVGFYDNTYSGPGYYSGGCSAAVSAYDPVTGPFGYQPVYCPYGVLPILPWGDLVPN